MVFGVGKWEALGFLFIASGLIAEYATKHFFPKRPDIFKELTELNRRLNDLEAKTDETNSTVTAMQFRGKS